MRSLVEVDQRRSVSSRHLLLTFAGVCASLALIAIAAQQTLLAVGVILFLLAVLAVVCWFEACAPLVIFILYTNAAVVAVKFHGLPHVAALLAVAPLLIPLAYFVVWRRQQLILTSTLPLILLFLMAQMLSALYSRQPDIALKTLKTSLLEGLGIYFVITNVIRTRNTLRWTVWALLAAGAFLGGLSLFQQATGSYQKNYGGFAQVSEGQGFGVEGNRGTVRQRRLCGPIGEQNRYAQIMLMLMPLGFFMSSGKMSSWRKAAAILATGLTAVGFTLAFSRGAAVGLALLIVLMILMRYINLGQTLAVAVAILVLLIAIPQYRTRLLSIPSAVGVVRKHGSQADVPDGAIRGRATAMLAAARVWAVHPVLGVGPGNFNFYSREYGQEGGLRALEGTREAHNLYLDIAAEQGTVGLVIFLLIVFISIGNLARVRGKLLQQNPQDARLATGFLLAIVGYLATGLFLHFSYVRYFWLMIALADSASHILSRTPSEVAGPSSASSS